MYQELTNSIMEACNRVHYELGPGFLHQVYRRATMIELSQSRINYTYIKHLPVEYMGQFLGQEDVRVLIVEKNILLATAALRMTDQRTAVNRLISLLKRMQLNLGFIANFHETKLSITPVRVK
jgi:GxxExxY protein